MYRRGGFLGVIVRMRMGVVARVRICAGAGAPRSKVMWHICSHGGRHCCNSGSERLGASKVMPKLTDMYGYHLPFIDNFSFIIVYTNELIVAAC